MNSKVDLIIDGQYGSTGKGLLAGYLSEKNNYDTVISANRPNAGHTAYDFNDNKFVHKAIASGVFSKGLKHIMIGPGSVFSPAKLISEFRNIRDKGHALDATLYIHEAAVPLTEDMKKFEEQSAVTKIASTAQGTMVAQIQKMMRDPDVPTTIKQVPFSDEGLPIRVVNNSVWTNILYHHADNILLEGSQGFSLGINQPFYPYCTSRECTPAQFLADAAIPHKMLRKVIGVIRTFPIRVGNTSQGVSGPYYYDQEERTWEELGFEPEITTVTGRVRRVFTFSDLQYTDFLKCCNPDEIFLNFVNYIEENRDIARNIPFVRRLAINAEIHGARLRYLGHGPKSTDVEDLDEMEG